ncbi:acyltransferase [Gammaproteobacteria bacterium ESL0073]|nr:acyltransferase [Gammaproteobacteria bacterium ESL0073]
MKFRKDINGLRAIAVIAVVLFHFKIYGFSGGFAGVDIFFVISGYLMTGIIFTKLDRSQFSIIEFYLHRARRIIPALAVLCLFLIVFGFFFFLTHEYRETMRGIKSAIQFISNIAFSQEGDYFALPAQDNWLLHTWSLSVEWQFYIIYPAIILLLNRFLTKALTKSILIICALASFGLSVIYTPIDATSAFYLLPTRAWEMLAGGLVFLFPLSLSKNTRSLFFYTGLITLILCLILLNDDIQWPGYWAIFPVIGAMLIISANQENIITSNSAFQWLGKISYSVYLWHWPVVVLLLTAGLLTNPYYVTGGIIVSILLGALSYQLIETRVKLKYSYWVECIKYILIIAIITGLAASLASIAKKHGARDIAIIPSYIRDIIRISDARNPYNKCLQTQALSTYPECKAGAGKPSIIVFGDSHANVTFSALLQANDKGASILWAYMGCPIIEDIKFTISRRVGCQTLIKEKLALLDKDYENTPVLMVNRLYNNLGNDKMAPIVYFTTPHQRPTKEFLQEFQDHYVKTICRISRKHPVYILKPIPEANFNVPEKLLRESFFAQPTTVEGTTLKNYHQLNSFIIESMEKAKNECGAVLLDPVPYLCPNGKCQVSHDGKPFYFDDNHLSEYGNKRLVPLFKQIFNQPTAQEQ